MEFFKQYQTLILRSIGALMLVIGFVIHFWATPKKGISENELAAANVARMEAQVKGSSPSSKKSTKADSSKFLEKLKTQREKQLEYLTIFVMLLGVGSLGYSFLVKKSDT
jgi:hypothetical protein